MLSPRHEIMARHRLQSGTVEASLLALRRPAHYEAPVVDESGMPGGGANPLNDSCSDLGVASPFLLTRWV